MSSAVMEDVTQNEQKRLKFNEKWKINCAGGVCDIKIDCKSRVEKFDKRILKKNAEVLIFQNITERKGLYAHEF